MIIWGLEMRGPQIMRNISQLLGLLLHATRPKSEGEGTALTARALSHSSFTARNGRCLGAAYFRFGPVHIGKIK